MTNVRQYVVATFNPWDTRSYTYHHDGEPVAVGNKVFVTTAKGQVIVDVIAVHHDKPHFPTKPIDGRAESPIEDDPGDPETF